MTIKKIVINYYLVKNKLEYKVYKIFKCFCKSLMMWVGKYKNIMKGGYIIKDKYVLKKNTSKIKKTIYKNLFSFKLGVLNGKRCKYNTFITSPIFTSYAFSTFFCIISKHTNCADFSHLLFYIYNKLYFKYNLLFF